MPEKTLYRWRIKSTFTQVTVRPTVYWSNVGGWGNMESATVFTQEEKDTHDKILSLPICGEWDLVIDPS